MSAFLSFFTPQSMKLVDLVSCELIVCGGIKSGHSAYVMYMSSFFLHKCRRCVIF